MSETKRLSKRERQEIRIAKAKKKKKITKVKTFIGFVLTISVLTLLYFQL